MPALLVDHLGHSVRRIGPHERLMPVTETVIERGTRRKIVRQHVAPGVASVFELSLIKQPFAASKG